MSDAFTPFTHAVLAQFSAQPGTGAHTAARWAARRLAQEVYLEDCRAARERRDKWLAILDADTEKPYEKARAAVGTTDTTGQAGGGG